MNKDFQNKKKITVFYPYLISFLAFLAFTMIAFNWELFTLSVVL